MMSFTADPRCSRVLLAVALAFFASHVLAGEADQHVHLALLALAAGDDTVAVRELATALELEPDFEIADVLRADLERRRRGHASVLDQDSMPPAGIARSTWRRWQREVRQRALPGRAGTYAGGLHVVPQAVELVLIAETERNQLHVVGRDGAAWRVRETLYLSIGRRGVGKQVSGDRRTPLGLYWIVDRLEDHQLPPRYGPLAFPLDYPNDLDRGLGRRGDGIWLHGTDPSTYARPPLDSDGCLVLADADLLRLATVITMSTTPVVIARSWPFADKPAVARLPAGLGQALEQWMREWQGGGGVLPPVELDELAIEELFVADYPGEPDLYLLRFRISGRLDGATRSTWKRLYVRKSAAGAFAVEVDGSG